MRYADYGTGETQMKRRRLATETGCGVATIDRAIAELTEAGALTVEPQYDSHGDQAPNLFIVHRTRGGSPVGEEGVAPSTSRQETENLDQREGTTSGEVVQDARASDDIDRSPSDVGRVYSTWRMERGKTRKAYDRISPNRRTKIEARLREFTADELCEAIRGVARDPWKDRPLHDDLVVIFRNREQVEKFLELAAGTAANGRGTSADAVRIVEETLARTRGAR